MATSSRKGRIGQSQYWTMFGLYFLAVLILAGGAIYSLLSLNFGLAIIAFLSIAPLGIYFRVIMMRRCRDIGWPAFLPWLLFAVPIAFTMTRGLGVVANPDTTVDAMALSALTAPLLISLVDLGFSIVIGCIASRPDEDLAQLFGPGPGDPAPARPIAQRDEPWADAPRRDLTPSTGTSAEGDYSSFDAAVARALEARRNPQPQPAAAPEPIPAQAHARAVAGFGRKMV